MFGKHLKPQKAHGKPCLWCPFNQPLFSRHAMKCVFVLHRELKEKIQPEILELIKQQRLNRLVEGTCFRKLNCRRRQGTVLGTTPPSARVNKWPVPWSITGHGCWFTGRPCSIVLRIGMAVQIRFNSSSIPKENQRITRRPMELNSHSGPFSAVSLPVVVQEQLTCIESLPCAQLLFYLF